MKSDGREALKHCAKRDQIHVWIWKTLSTHLPQYFAKNLMSKCHWLKDNETLDLMSLDRAFCHRSVPKRPMRKLSRREIHLICKPDRMDSIKEFASRTFHTAYWVPKHPRRSCLQRSRLRKSKGLSMFNWRPSVRKVYTRTSRQWRSARSSLILNSLRTRRDMASTFLRWLRIIPNRIRQMRGAIWTYFIDRLELTYFNLHNIQCNRSFKCSELIDLK